LSPKEFNILAPSSLFVGVVDVVIIFLQSQSVQVLQLNRAVRCFIIALDD
jgi:hypothetical protein